jgi:hypothetical protein
MPDIIAAEPSEAKAQLLARLRGDAPYFTLRDSMESMAARNADILKRGPDAGPRHLTFQVLTGI